MSHKKETIKTKIWLEEPEDDNPFVAKRCYCAGYDVYGDLLGKVTWIQYLYLLFKLELPNPQQEKLLETLAVAIANPGIRDYSVRAAMNGGVCGSTRASSLIAAIAVGAGNLQGGHEIFQMIRWWDRLGMDLNRWRTEIKSPSSDDTNETWISMEHIPGFDPNGVSCSTPVLKTLTKLAELSPGKKLKWLRENRSSLEAAVGYPLSMSGIVATAFVDLGFDEGQSEILYLILRLPGAAAHSVEQEKYGWNQYPFFGQVLKSMPDNEYQALLNSLGEKD